ncbi:hypothetical protein D918_09578 [Trichuris suis]|nr:hypothetical protein D918_09578 [Trichuris suis]
MQRNLSKQFNWCTLVSGYCNFAIRHYNRCINGLLCYFVNPPISDFRVQTAVSWTIFSI